MKSRNRARTSPPNELVWLHDNCKWRVSSWPELRFERLVTDKWLPQTPDESTYAAAALQLTERDRDRYLEFVGLTERAFVAEFKIGWLAALEVVSRCPELISVLVETPGLTPFLAAHADLRGAPAPAWGEISAVYDRGSIFALLEWLGLPASRQTLRILKNLVDPDIPRRLLEPLRMILWEPTSIFLLQRTEVISSRQLAYFCHALAA
jgi:hypothetical protein